MKRVFNLSGETMGRVAAVVFFYVPMLVLIALVGGYALRWLGLF